MRKPAATARRTESGRRAAVAPKARKSGNLRTAKALGRRNGAVARAPAPKTASKTLRERMQPSDKVLLDTGTGASRGKYVYCIIEANDPLRFGPIGIGTDPSEVYTVHYKTLAAVVSDAPLEVLDSTRENVLAHERVNETVMRRHTEIPIALRTIFKTREDIVELRRSAA